MNRTDRIREVLRLEGLAAAARRRADEHREHLAAEARAELEQQGTAPSWRLPDIGTVTLPLSKLTPVVADPAKLVAWAQQRYPTEVETIHQVRAAFQGALLARVLCDEDLVVDPDTGEAIPGLTVRPGGTPGQLTIRASRDVKDVYLALGESVLEALGEPVVEVPSS
jgi:hypothetical protein